MVTQGSEAGMQPNETDPITEWFLDQVTWFAIYSCILGIVMLIGTYVSIMLFNFAAHSQVSYRNIEVS